MLNFNNNFKVYYGEYHVTPVTIQNKNHLEIISYNIVQIIQFSTEMHRCAVHKLTNWHIRLKSNTKGAVTLRLQVRDMVTQMHLCKTTINDNKQQYRM